MINNYISQRVTQSVACLTLLTVGLPMTTLPGAAEPTLLPSTPFESETPESVTPEAVTPATNQSTYSTTSQLDAVTTSQIDDSYTLGAGDLIRLDFFNVPEYTGEMRVLADGSLNLPLIGRVSVEGMTLQEASTAIATAYGPFLRKPINTVSLIRPRPLRISIAGEVNRPGSYTMLLTSEAGSADESQWPTVTHAIQTAGGITQQADVSDIRIDRKQRLGEPQAIKVNLWQLLQQADLGQDLPLRDGDNIIIPTATSIGAAEATQLSTASFAPDTIRVSVVGEVITPGIVEVPPNTPLNQALLTAGGFDRKRARTSQVELVRLNPDGTVTQRTVPIDFAQGINETSNPVLRNNDVVVVGRSGSARFSDAMDGVLGTLGRILPFFTLF